MLAHSDTHLGRTIKNKTVSCIEGNGRRFAMIQLDITEIESDTVVGPDVIGTIYGDVGTNSFKFSMIGHAERSDYITVEHPDCGPVLCQIDSIIRKSNYTLDKSLERNPEDRIDERVIGSATVIGYRDSNGLLNAPRTPFAVGSDVKLSDGQFIKKIVGLKDDAHRCAYIGMLRNYDLRIMLDINSMVQRHVSILAKTGGGKSYISGDIIEELMKHGVTCMIVDPHGEYGAMRDPADNRGDMRFSVSPHSYQDSIVEFGMNEDLDIHPLRFTLRSLDARDLMELCASSDSKTSVLALSKAMENVKSRKEFYDIRDLIEEVSSIDSAKHYALIRDLQSLDSLRLFAEKGNSLSELVQKGKTTIINLKGYSPDIQQIIVRRLGNMLFTMRKAEKIPPMMLVLEEAHNYCPQAESTACKKSIITIASEGRKFGLGLMVISQRPAKIDKNVLSQCGTQIILKVTNPNDLKAISASVEGLTGGMEQDISNLPIGTALIVGAGIQTPLLVDVRPRETRHGGASVQVLEDDSDE